jgi:hypothetical protein
MLSTCPPHVTGAALVVSSCRRPDLTGTAASVSYCLTARYCWYCAGRLKLSTTRYYWYCCVRHLVLDGPVLLVLRWPSQAVNDQLLLQRFFPPNR